MWGQLKTLKKFVSGLDGASRDKFLELGVRNPFGNYFGNLFRIPFRTPFGTLFGNPLKNMLLNLFRNTIVVVIKDSSTQPVASVVLWQPSK